jgi:hypothetical protein
MKKIVVLMQGWVVVGQLERDGDWFLLINGSVVRRWGTSMGLGELASKGPLTETKLEPIPLTKFHQDKVVFIMNCSEDKWK